MGAFDTQTWQIWILSPGGSSAMLVICLVNA